MNTPVVAASEHDLIMMARALVAPQSHDVWALLCKSRKLPDAIGPTCAGLVSDTLRHVWPALWRRSGGRPATSILDGNALRGRGWERHGPAPLDHSLATLKLLRWLIATPLGAPVATVEPLSKMKLTIGDQVVVYLALDAAQGTSAQRMLARQPFVRATPLAWLGFAHLIDSEPTVSFDSLARGTGAIVIEALTTELARRWHAIELGKRAMTSTDDLVSLGAAQDATLRGFMDACDQHRRRDLAAFVIDAAAPLLERNLSPAPMQLDATATLSARTGARLAAGALTRAVMRWNEWDQQHRSIRFIDDDYRAAQFLLSRFERIGSAGADRAATWLSDLGALAPTRGPASDTIEHA